MADSAASAGQGTPAPKVIRRRWQTLGSLVEVLPEGVNNVSEQEWGEIEMAVDSGATETGVGEEMLTSIDNAGQRVQERREVRSGQRRAHSQFG